MAVKPFTCWSMGRTPKLQPPGMAGLRAKGIKVIVYEPTVKGADFNGYPVIADLKEFEKQSDLILANRITDELKPLQDKVYSRDLFGRD